ncbi:MAG: haloacid dehalogenase type II [Gammaproteobacteria bacterium]|jgi:2-haloacid dehalogenase|nr:haloacid dehalogenase type II [Gammaproteobacteria bacterium]
MTVLQNIKACVFDAYGTLFDVHSAVGKHRSRIGEKADQLSMIWRTKQLEYTWLRSLMGAHVDFWKVTQDGLDYAAETCGIDDSKLLSDLMQAYLALDCYPEVKETLAALTQKDVKTAILSNGSPHMLAAAVESAGLQDLLDGVFSIEDVGIYKPAPRVYQLACNRLGVSASEISFQSSNAWDAAAAANFGMNVVWINRFGQKRERLPKPAHAELPTLAGLPELLA